MPATTILPSVGQSVLLIADGCDEGECGISESHGFGDFVKVAGDVFEVTTNGIANLETGENVIQQRSQFDGFRDISVLIEMLTSESGKQASFALQAAFVVIERPSLLRTRVTGKLALIDPGEEVEDVFEHQSRSIGDCRGVFGLFHVSAEEFHFRVWPFHQRQSPLQIPAAEFQKLRFLLCQDSPAEFEAQGLVMAADDDVMEVRGLIQQKLVEPFHVRLVHGGNRIVEEEDGLFRVLTFLKGEEEAEPEGVEVGLGQARYRAGILLAEERAIELRGDLLVGCR